MGTSNPFGGGNNRNPLIPDWVGGGGDGPPAPPGAPDGGGPDGDNPEGRDGGDPPAPNRFQSARTNFFKFAKAGGDSGGTGGGGGNGRGRSNRNMRRAIGSFVGKASGGAHRAAQRMAAERSATASLGRILSDAGTAGIQETVRRLGFAQLAALPVPDIYAALVDVICEPGGELDESFAREAYIKALTEISGTQADLERPTPETTASFLASFITNAIENRLLNAIGNKVVSVPIDVASVQNVEQQINDYIRGKVNDAMSEAGEDFPIDLIVSTIDDIYDRSLDLLQDVQDREASADDDVAGFEAQEEIA